MEKNNSIENIKQITSLEESETHILLDYFDKKIKIYSTRASVNRRMIKAGYIPTKEHKIDGEIYALSFEFPTSQIGKFLRTSIFKYD